MSARLAAGEHVLLTDRKGRRYLVQLEQGGEFHFHRGIVSHDDVIGGDDGASVRSTGGEWLLVFRPTLAEVTLKMKRGAQVVYPKDTATILVQGDIYPGAVVVEAGVGSGALSLALLRAVGPGGRVIAYEVREDHAALARKNVERFAGGAANFDLRVGDIYEEGPGSPVDRAVLDLPEPWRALPVLESSLRPGGILTSYLPSVVQVQRLAEALQTGAAWGAPVVMETLVRTWHIDGQAVRPDHRMIGHTAFLVVARRVGPKPPTGAGPENQPLNPEGYLY